MPSSPPSPDRPPDRFQREIDDIIRLAEKRLERQQGRGRGGKRRRRRWDVRQWFRGLRVRLPSAQYLAGWGLALMLLSWLVGLLGFTRGLATILMVLGIALLVAGLILSLTVGSGTGIGGGEKVWRGERISYGSPYGSDLLERIKRFFRGR